MRADTAWSMPRLVGTVVLATLLFVALAIGAPMLWQSWRPAQPSTAPVAETGAPWQIKLEAAGGSEVFGLGLGRSTLADAAARWPGERLQIALVRSPAGALSLEAYLESVQASGVQGKLVLGVVLPTALAQQWAERSPRDTPLASGAHQLGLRHEDALQAQAQVIDSLLFLPAARLDEATLVERFGAPGERLATTDGLVHLLYPERGLVISLADSGRQRTVLQYVAPRDFARLRTPLLAAIQP
jgi:hypothetical protein